MADKLDWQNKHLVLLRYTALKDAADNENYKVRPDLAEFFTGTNNAEELVFKLAKAEKYKEACELLAYIAHRRAAVWWGYRCVLSLFEELAVNPAADEDISQIGASFDVTVPDWAKQEIPEPDPAIQAKLVETSNEIWADNARIAAQADPEMLKFMKDAVEVAFQEFKRVHGIHPIDMLKKLGERLGEDPERIDPASPVFVEKAKLKAQLAAVQKETVETIKSVLPPKVPEHEKKLRDNAMAAVYRWVAAPDDPNSKACLDIGNECPDTPAGLLALTAFWSFGNLMPGGEQVIAAPPGLAANGICQTLLLAALHKGGSRKVKERYEEYFRLGVDVLTGKDTWAHALASDKAPHEMDPGQAPSGERAKPPESSGDGPAKQSEYKRWKPPGLKGSDD